MPPAQDRPRMKYRDTTSWWVEKELFKDLMITLDMYWWVDRDTGELMVDRVILLFKRIQLEA